MKPQTDPDLTLAILARAGDLVHHMTRKGYQIAVASGPAPNGVECSVVMCVGPAAETLRDFGRLLAERIVEMREEAEQN